MAEADGKDNTKVDNADMQKASREVENNESMQNLKKEYDELKERHARTMAEFDNYKKRVQKDIDSAKELGTIELTRALLGTLDEFDLTLAVASKSDDKVLAKGVELLYANFVETLKSFGLEDIDASSKADPYKHEIAMVAQNDKPEGSIIEVIKKGYSMHGKIIRPATVIVSKGNGQSNNNV
ncbi:MAG: nucleotide exchange factor GrpE [Candidatus Micrarchaeaceae archaeon]